MSRIGFTEYLPSSLPTGTVGINVIAEYISAELSCRPSPNGTS